MSQRSGLLIRAAAVAQVLVEDLGDPTLSAEDLNHLAKALRVRLKETVIATDGAGRWRECDWTGTETLDSVGEIHSEAKASPEITVAFALLKGDKPEWVVQKLTEVGVDHIIPITVERSIVKWDDTKATKNVERFRRVAYEAAMQSRRVWLPEVADVTSLAAVVGAGAALAEAGGGPISLDTAMVAVGPEGGWSQGELALAKTTVDLGPTVLRAETAATTVGGLLCAIRANVVNSSPSVLKGS